MFHFNDLSAHLNEIGSARHRACRLCIEYFHALYLAIPSLKKSSRLLPKMFNYSFELLLLRGRSF